MNEEAYRTAFPSNKCTFDQWRGAVPYCETYEVTGGIHSGVLLLMWYYEGCQIFTDVNEQPICVAPCRITENYYVSCVWGKWTLHYFSSDSRKSWSVLLTELDPSSHWRDITRLREHIFKVRPSDVKIISIIKQAILITLDELKERTGR